MGMGRNRSTRLQLRDWPPEDINERAGRLAVGAKLRQSGCRIADGADQPQNIPRLSASPIGDTRGSPPDCGPILDALFGQAGVVTAGSKVVYSLADACPTFAAASRG